MLLDTLKAVAYLRVSTEEQTVENQRLVLQEYALRNNYEIVQVFEDSGTSGSVPAMERSGFSALFHYIKNNYVQAVLVYELSRVGRTFWDTLDAIQFIEKYAPLISCSPKELFLQTTDPSVRKLLIGIISWVAERERETLIQRTKAGLARARLEGRIGGRRPKPIDLEKLRRLLATDMKMQQIAIEFGMSEQTLYKKIKLLN